MFKKLVWLLLASFAFGILAGCQPAKDTTNGETGKNGVTAPEPEPGEETTPPAEESGTSPGETAPPSTEEGEKAPGDVGAPAPEKPAGGGN